VAQAEGRSVIFYLGVHMPNWLEQVNFPLFISRTRLANHKTLPRAAAPWALDSGGFTQLNLMGQWNISPARYIREVRRYTQEIGHLEWAAPMDWMCEPWIIAKTGLSITEHQRRTVDNYLTLRAAAPDLPFIPVLQGWSMADYLQCADMYAAAGVDLTALPLVGLGSVCRRQSTGEIGAITATLANYGLNLHGFGVKTAGLRSYSIYLASADSMAWSARGRRIHPCIHGRAKSEANCLTFAREWRTHVLDLPPHTQLDLFGGAVA
jgi:hypothetical protein